MTVSPHRPGVRTPIDSVPVAEAGRTPQLRESKLIASALGYDFSGRPFDAYPVCKIIRRNRIAGRAFQIGKRRRPYVSHECYPPVADASSVGQWSTSRSLDSQAGGAGAVKGEKKHIALTAAPVLWVTVRESLHDCRLLCCPGRSSPRTFLPERAPWRARAPHRSEAYQQCVQCAHIQS